MPPDAEDASTSSAGSAGTSTDDGPGPLDSSDADSGSESTSGSSSDATTTSAGNNTPPDAQDDVFYTRQAESAMPPAPGVLANDLDADGDPVTVIGSYDQSNDGADVMVGANGDVSFLPIADHWGPDSFDYIISDGMAQSSATVTFYVAPVAIPLARVVEGHGGFAVDGEVPGDLAGNSLSAAGDVNGDGFGDILVATFGPIFGGPSRAYLVFGAPDLTGVALTDVADGVGGFVMYDASNSGMEGHSLAGAGDFDGDGLADVVIGLNGPLDRALVVFGKASTEPVDLSLTLQGVGGFAILGEDVANFGGVSVAAAGDVDGDGRDDIVVGSSGVDDYTGRAYVVFGRDGTDPVDLGAVSGGGGGGFAIDGEELGDNLGHWVSGAGDVNDDGRDDVVVVGPSAGPDAFPIPGRAYVVFGKGNTDAVALTDVVGGEGGFAIDSETGSNIGSYEARAAGDVDGDGFADVIVGAMLADPDGNYPYPERSYVVSGKADGDLVDLADVAAGVGGFALDGEGDGPSIAGAGDVNDDGFGDVIVADDAGAYVIYGSLDGEQIVLDDVAASGSGFALLPEGGVSVVRGGGDVNGDGVEDIVCAAPALGRSYVVFGVPTEPTK